MWPSVNDLAIAKLPIFSDARGSLTPVEFGKFVPFPVERLFWVNNVPAGSLRGAHAHKACHQFFICMSGRIGVKAFDGVLERDLELAAGDALHVKPNIFAEERYIETGTVLMVLCSHQYDPDDYVHTREQFLQNHRGRK